LSRSRVLIAVAGGAASALCYLMVALGSPGAFILAYLAQLPLFLIGFSLGVVPAAIASAVGTLAVLAATSLPTAAVYLVMTAGAATLIVRQALLNRPGPSGGVEWYPSGLLLCWLTGAGLVFLAMAAIYGIAAGDGLQGLIRDRLMELYAAISVGSEQDRATAAEAIARIFPAAAVGSWMTMAMANGALAQGALARFSRAIRPSPAVKDMWLPRWPGLVLVAATVLAVLAPGEIGMLATNTAIIAAIPYLFLGHAVLQSVVRIPYRLLFLFSLYLLLILLLRGWALAALAGIGFIEQWIGLRRRFAGAGSREIQ
jgi:hypothetical protein